MTLTHLDLDRIEGLAGRLRQRRESRYDGRTQDHEWVSDEMCVEAASDLTALIAYTRELEAALTKTLRQFENCARHVGNDDETIAAATTAARSALPRKTS